MAMTFDSTYYFNQNPDVQAAYLAGDIPSAEWHYENYGWAEGRNPNASFDNDNYLLENPDVLAAVQNGTFASPLQHFQMYGSAEGRDPNTNWATYDLSTFDEDAYLAEYSDVQQAVDDGTFTNGLQHFMLYGSFEERVGTLEDGTVIDDDAVNPSTGETFSLTTAIDNIQGTTGDDKVFGAVVADNDTGTSLNPGDAINGAGGTDTLSISATGARTGDVTSNSFTLTGVEKVLVSNFASGNQTNIIDVSTADSSLATIGLSSSSTAGTGVGSTKFDNVQKIVDVELKDGGADFEVAYAASAVSGTDDTQKVTLSNHAAATGVANPTLTLSEGIETLALTSTGATNKVKLAAGNKHAKVTVDGAKDLTLDVNDTTNDTIKSVDASTFTGDLTLSGLSDLGSVELSVVGGAGDDTVTTPANLSSNDTVDGGAGTNTLKVGAALSAANSTNVTNFQTLEATSNITQDASIFSGITKVVSSNETNGTVTFSNLGADTSMDITGGNGAADNVTATLKTDTTSDSIDVKIGPTSSTTATGIQIGTLTLNNHETINLESTGGTTAVVNDIDTALTSSSATDLVVTGDRDLEIKAFTSSSNLKSLDASGLTGKLTMGAALVASGDHTVTGGSGDDSLSGSTGNDVIVGNAGDDTIAGGGGDDSIDGSAGDDAITVGAATAADKVVTVVGGDGADTVTLNSTTGYFDVDLGAGDDTFNAANGNTFYIDSNDTVAGGEGTDALAMVATNGTAQDLTSTTALSNVSGFETVALNVSALTANNNTYGFTFDDILASGIGGGTLDIEVKDATSAANAGADVTINAAAVLLNTTNVNVDTSDAAVQYVYHVGGATENVVLGAQDDDVLVATAGNLSANDTVDGGSGSDKLALNYAATSSTEVTINASSWGNVSGFETVNLDNVTGTGTGKITFNLTDAFASNNAATSNNTLTVIRAQSDGTTIDDTGATKIDGSDVTATKLDLTGADGADTLNGGSKDDVITGKGGSDKIDLSAGGEDRVNFDQNAATNEAVLTGFMAYGDGNSSAPDGMDKLYFKESVFTGTAANLDISVGGYTEGAGGTVTLDDQGVTVITTTGYADYDTMFAAQTAGTLNNAGIVAFYNISTQRAEVYYDPNLTADTGEVLIGAFTDVTLTGMADFAADNFVGY